MRAHPRHFPLATRPHTLYTRAHTRKRRDTMDMDDIAATLAVGILAVMHEAALLAGGVQ